MSETITDISDDSRVEFHLTEYKLLKDEISQNQRIRLQIELFTISAAGLITSFFVSNQAAIETYQIAAVWWLPLFILYFGFIWSRSHVQRSSEIGAYLARVEAKLGFQDLGWEKTIAPLKIARGGSISRAKRILWIGLFVFFLLLALRVGTGSLWQFLGIL